VESLSAAVRQVELERNEVQSQLNESQALTQALRDKLENIQHDLASQGLQLVCLSITSTVIIIIIVTIIDEQLFWGPIYKES